jgi:tetratricopeptide (TPR) repeat protein
MHAMNGEPIQALIQESYDRLNASDMVGAYRVLEEALKHYYEEPELIYGLKCLKWWLSKLERLEDFKDSYDRGGYLLSQWRAFYGFLDRIGEDFDRCRYALKRFVFSAALESFQDLLGDGVNQFDPGLLLQVGRCYKGVGNYEAALKYLAQAGRFKREDGETLSELADVHALLEETRAAKVLFREAFYLDPQGVDLRSMESEMILRLRNKVMGLGYELPELAEWIPIYGSLFGVFSIRRELKPVELGRLKQSVYALETEFRSAPERASLIKPRLLNRYFWLIDHYENGGEHPALVEETMLKIKLIDPMVYDRYRA